MTTKTMNDLYNDGSDHKHIACPECMFCESCGDCVKHGCGRFEERDVQTIRNMGEQLRTLGEKGIAMEQELWRIADKIKKHID